MHPSRFHVWLAQTLGQPVEEVSFLLSQEMAVEFLMSWSLFEARCFSGFMRFDQVEAFAKRIVEQEAFDSGVLLDHFNHFHDRYQDEVKRRNLFQQQKSELFRNIVLRTKINAAAQDVVFLCTAVAYRFRNNMFHGSKGVRSWLHYQEQIERCSSVIQQLTSHAESRSKLIALPSA